MNKWIFFTIFFIGLAGNVMTLPRLCRYSRSTKKLECKLSRIAKNMNSLTIPRDAKIVVLQNNKLSNTAEIQAKLETLPNLENLDLSYNEIANGMRDLVAMNKNLEDFRIRNNLIRTIHERMFENNRKLEKVDLSNNMLTSLPRRLFFSNPRLNTVLLWANNLEEVPEDLFRNNKDIEVINLSWNKLTDIPERFFRGLTNLKKVIIWKNQLTCLYSSMFQDNSLLNTFHAAINKIRKVPDQIFDNNPDLEDVRFWSNRLECIPKQVFQKNDNIRYVNFLLGNEKLPWELKQRFSKTGFHNVFKMANELHVFGNGSCTAAPCEWNPETLTMDCSHRGLTDLSTLNDVCEKVRNLNLDGNALNDPGSLTDAMNSMRSLRSVTAQDNDMTGPLQDDTFKNNWQLTLVDLSKNRITKVPKATFETNPILKNVNLGDNDIEEIFDDTFVNNPELTELDLSQNEIKELSKVVFQNNRMMISAKFSRNKISKIDEETFTKTEKLRVLDLSDNQLQGEMYMDIFEYAPEMEDISLKGNRITHMRIKDTNKMLNKSLVLDLSFNKLEEFPVEMVQERVNLKRLILHHNKITTIPDGALHKNVMLTEIDLSYNRLMKLSNTTFSKNTWLEILRLDNNALTRLEAGLLDGNPRLKYFSVNGNKIHYIAPTLFLFNIHLEEARFSDNAISKLPEELFQPCGESLRFVTLTRNNLNYLARDTFLTNDNLEHVCLHGNNLWRLPKTPLPADGNDGGTPPKDGERHDVPDVIPGQLRENDQFNFVGKVPVRILKDLLRSVREPEEDN